MAALGELETLVLLAILRLGDDAYGVGVGHEIGSRTGRRLSRGAIYTALRRLEAKGYVGGALGDPTPERGGRAKRFLHVTAEGLDALRSSTGDVDRMRAGLEPLLGGS